MAIIIIEFLIYTSCIIQIFENNKKKDDLENKMMFLRVYFYCSFALLGVIIIMSYGYFDIMSILFQFVNFVIIEGIYLSIYYGNLVSSKQKNDYWK